MVRPSDVAERRCALHVAAVQLAALPVAVVLGYVLWRLGHGGGAPVSGVIDSARPAPVASQGGAVPAVRLSLPPLAAAVPLIAPVCLLCGTALVSWLHLHRVRGRLDRERYESWESEWEIVEPRWRGSGNSV